MNRMMARIAACSSATLLLVMTPQLAGATTVQAGPRNAHPSSIRYELHHLGFAGSINALNDVGLAVGQWNGQAFSWNAWTQQRTDLQTLGGYASTAYGVNNRGQIVGESDAAGQTHAVLWNRPGAKPIDLGTLGGQFSIARAINNLGVVVGESDTADGSDHAFRWDPRTHHMSDLGTLGGKSSSATAINDRGQIVGSASTSEGLADAFRWDPRTGHMQDLGLLPHSVVSFATGINNRGEVVGYTNDVGDFTDRAFRWDPKTQKMSTLPGVPDVYGHATGINDLGQIAGYWNDQSGFTTPFIWSPASHRPVALPYLTAQPYSSFAITSAINNRSWVAGYDGSAVLWIPDRGWH
ncbi:YD repeat-containing protein/probable extracellular repeat, HAF family [Nakamurella panacisegetis]|uniref:YD repeat-containing protein/probable extracellular repeat, HAF family n=1 Tax=Nakamurella panacisegetis TaxID=1090615 RepID=A0A1H0LP83_9ACTN|nr:hypothetical protein [Nakamurella panacisegetis]SDO69935.1 YD repeat-containing protein/probable extracellular repeat, HAF family [Nakamurella panacisegetis]